MCAPFPHTFSNHSFNRLSAEQGAVLKVFFRQLLVILLSTLNKYIEIDSEGATYN